jgi:hypothetical protein
MKFFHPQNLIWALLLFGVSALTADSVKTLATYQQIFADKKITLTEKMSWLDYSMLRNKKGFVKYED